MENILKLNKKGADPQSILFTIVTLFALGIIIVFFNHFFSSFYDEIDVYLNSSADFNDSTASDTLDNIIISNNSAWDYAMIGLVIGYLIILGATAFATRISPFFFFVYLILAIIGLFVATILSNTWIEIASQPDMQSTIARFPITNALLGSIYPTLIAAVIMLVMILLFGKPFSGGEAR